MEAVAKGAAAVMVTTAIEIPPWMVRIHAKPWCELMCFDWNRRLNNEDIKP